MDELKDSFISVAPYPVAWRVEIVDDVKHRGFGYVRWVLDVAWHIEVVH
jgi:hypothetical protein